MALAVALLFALCASAACGYLYARMGMAETVSLAKGDARTCVDSANQQQSVLAELAGDKATQIRDHTAYLTEADKSLAQRTAEADRLIADGQLTSNQIKELARADPDCAALTLLPLCPAVADRLWPRQEAAGGEPAERHQGRNADISHDP